MQNDFLPKRIVCKGQKRITGQGRNIKKFAEELYNFVLDNDFGNTMKNLLERR